MNTAVGRSILIGVVLCLLSVRALHAEDELEDFAAAVNSAWSATNDTEILNLVNQRLSENTNDVAALSVKAYYHLWIDGNISNAQQAVEVLAPVIQTSTNQAAKDFFEAMQAELEAVPLSESGPFPAEGLDQLRRESRGIFPNIRNCVWLAKVLGP